MGLEPATFGATIRRLLFLRVAVHCRIGLSKPILLLTVARRFCVSRPEWCQEWCQIASAAPRVPISLSTHKTSPGPPLS